MSTSKIRRIAQQLGLSVRMFTRTGQHGSYKIAVLFDDEGRRVKSFPILA